MRITPNIHVAAADICLPQQVEPDNGQSNQSSRPLIMALRAATRTLATAGLDAADLDLLVHAWVDSQGEGNWAPPHRLADRLGAHRCEPIGVQQQCAGGVAAVDIAVTRMLIDHRVHAALVVTSDDFAPSLDRYPAVGDNSISEMASGAAAVLLTRQQASLAIVASAARGRSDAEPIHTAQRLRFERRDQAVPMTLHQVMSAAKALQGALLLALTDALTDADLTAEDRRIRQLLLPRVHRGALEAALLPALPVVLRSKCRFLGEDTGHLGAGDTLANLYHLLEAADPGRRPGDYALLMSGGMGLTANCLAVRNIDIVS